MAVKQINWSGRKFTSLSGAQLVFATALVCVYSPVNGLVCCTPWCLKRKQINKLNINI